MNVGYMSQVKHSTEHSETIKIGNKKTTTVGKEKIIKTKMANKGDE